MNRLELGPLLELEEAGWSALCASRGSAFYGQLMLPEALMVLVNGMVLDRSAVIAGLDDAPPWDSFELAEARTVPVGTDSTALVYRARARRDGDAGPFVALMSSIYRLVEGVPRLALYQQTTLTH
ncbi:nuclear transport factor 2 family protein [Arthrobacter sp. JSM 101049]|uniref:nuclear transport factor 2 family protein n=1 Tax=Arthrobacter sp. JSM 101049 TaxID=929097 RepID=UPI00356AD725